PTWQWRDRSISRKVIFWHVEGTAADDWTGLLHRGPPPHDATDRRAFLAGRFLPQVVVPPAALAVALGVSAIALRRHCADLVCSVQQAVWSQSTASRMKSPPRAAAGAETPESMSSQAMVWTRP